MNGFDYSIHYRRFHDDSEEHAQQMSEALSRFIVPFVPKELSVPILDVGCGFGFALRALRSLGYTDLCGLEASPEQAERSGGAGFDVVVAEDTPAWLHEHSGMFGFILLLDVLEHVPVGLQIDLLRAAHAALRPGGSLLMTVPNANSILAARWRYIDYTHHSSFTEHSLYFVLKNAGFDRIELDTEKGTGRLPKRIWRKAVRQMWRKRFIRWCWLQIFVSELSAAEAEGVSFELNLRALAYKA